MKMLLISFFFLILIAGCTVPPQPNETKPTLENYFLQHASCTVDTDCIAVMSPFDGCCGWRYAMNKEGSPEYYKIFADDFTQKSDECQIEKNKGLSCSLILLEPVCVDNACKLKNKLNNDEIIDNVFQQ
jgi:hypothetical protein